MRPHISINVQDVGKAVDFYKKVFGINPQKQTQSYAKFDLKAPALNLAMQSGGEISRVSHFGIEVDSPGEIVEWEKHLTNQGILERKEVNSDCCYARQDKLWFEDPDHNEWEIFYVYEQLPVYQKEKQISCCG